MAEVILFRKRQPTEFVALIDEADAEMAGEYRWSVFLPIGSKTHYARATRNGKTLYLHRHIMGASDTDEVDHIDGDGLNNRRSNLRFVTRRENLLSAHRLPGRYGNPTIEELDRELTEFEAKWYGTGT